MTDVIDALVRAADVGETYLTWRWLDEVRRPKFAVLESATVGPVLAELDAAVCAAPDTDSGRPSMRRTLTEGAFAEVSRERSLSRSLTAVVLPKPLRAAIALRADAGMRVRLRVTPSPRLARVPWELLSVDADRRLLEVADVVIEPPATVHAERAVIPGQWDTVRCLPALLVIDPRVPSPAAQRYDLGHVLAARDLELFSTRIGDHVDAGRVDAEEEDDILQAPIDRVRLSHALRTPRSRFLYLGHVTSTPSEPGSAALHLHDTAREWGVAAPLRRRTADGAPIPDPGDHRPLTALDLLLGTSAADPHMHRRYGFQGPRPGPDLWPMPHRVALIACEGGADYRAAETFGLVMAMVNAGAALVTTTRWTLPADRAVAAVHPGAPERPTTALALRVDAAHDSSDPLTELGRWQLDRLQLWQKTGDLTYSPLIWAALAHTIAPARPITADPRSAPQRGTDDMGSNDGGREDYR